MTSNACLHTDALNESWVCVHIQTFPAWGQVLLNVSARACIDLKLCSEMHSNLVHLGYQLTTCGQYPMLHLCKDTRGNLFLMFRHAYCTMIIFAFDGNAMSSTMIVSYNQWLHLHTHKYSDINQNLFIFSLCKYYINAFTWSLSALFFL